MGDAFKLSRAALDDDDGELLSPLCKSIIDGTHDSVRPRPSRDDADMLRDLVTRIAKLEAASKRAPKKSTAAVSRKDFEFAIETIGRFVGKEINPIQERLTKLEARAEVRWAGVWHQDMRCAEGELITDKGALWLCTAPSSDRPDENATAYRLICKSGSHGNGVKRHATATRGF